MGIRQRVPNSWRPLLRDTLLEAGRLTGRWRMDPSFLIIGGQRCGTTTMFQSLAGHPQVLRPLVDKGTDYYTLFYDRGPEWYRSRMPLGPTSRLRTARTGAPKAFEACTYYMFHPFAIERIAADHPDIKLVAMLRNPVERAYSAYKHELARGFETEPNFMRALELEDERIAGETELMRRDASYESYPHRHHAYRHRGQFAEQLERVFSHFPRHQVHVTQSEAFFADPRGEYLRLTEFLELAPWAPKEFAQHNARPSSSMPMDAREFLTDHFHAHDRRLHDLLDSPLYWAA